MSGEETAFLFLKDKTEQERSRKLNIKEKIGVGQRNLRRGRCLKNHVDIFHELDTCHDRLGRINIVIYSFLWKFIYELTSVNFWTFNSKTLDTFDDH